MKEPKFHNKNGTLTPYAFACGYIEVKNDCKLYKDGCWHVRTPSVWESFNTLTEARKFFRKAIKSTSSTALMQSSPLYSERNLCTFIRGRYSHRSNAETPLDDLLEDVWSRNKGTDLSDIADDWNTVDEGNALQDWI